MKRFIFATLGGNHNIVKWFFECRTHQMEHATLIRSSVANACSRSCPTSSNCSDDRFDHHICDALNLEDIHFLGADVQSLEDDDFVRSLTVPSCLETTRKEYNSFMGSRNLHCAWINKLCLRTISLLSTTLPITHGRDSQHTLLLKLLIEISAWYIYGMA